MVRKVDIHLGVDVDVDTITAPVPFDPGPGYTLRNDRPAPFGHCWAQRADGHMKLIPRKTPTAPTEWGVL